MIFFDKKYKYCKNPRKSHITKSTVNSAQSKVLILNDLISYHINFIHLNYTIRFWTDCNISIDFMVCTKTIIACLTFTVYRATCNQTGFYSANSSNKRQTFPCGMHVDSVPPSSATVNNLIQTKQSPARRVLRRSRESFLLLMAAENWTIKLTLLLLLLRAWWHFTLGWHPHPAKMQFNLFHRLRVTWMN